VYLVPPCSCDNLILECVRRDGTSASCSWTTRAPSFGTTIRTRVGEPRGGIRQPLHFPFRLPRCSVLCCAAAHVGFAGGRHVEANTRSCLGCRSLPCGAARFFACSLPMHKVFLSAVLTWNACLPTAFCLLRTVRVCSFCLLTFVAHMRRFG